MTQQLTEKPPAVNPSSINASTAFSNALERFRQIPLLLYGILSACIGFLMYVIGILMVFPRYLLGLNQALLPTNEWIVWYSGLPIVVGLILALLDLLVLFPGRRHLAVVRYEPFQESKMTFALAVSNDEHSIDAAVCDFLDPLLA